MEERFNPSDDRDNTTTKEDSELSGSYNGVGPEDDDLMGAIGIDLESDMPSPSTTSIEDPHQGLTVNNEDHGQNDREDLNYLDPSVLGANVAETVRQLVSEKIDRIVTVAVEQAVTKELRRIQGKME